MINFQFNFDLGRFTIKITKDSNASSFTEIVSWLKQHYTKYDSKSHSWICDNEMTAKFYLEELKSFSDIYISDDDKYLLDNLIYPKDNNLHKYKVKLEKDYFKKFPILKGKEGFENYQEDTIKFLLSQNKGIVDLGVGHGKTYIIASVLYHLLVQGKIDKILFVCRPEGVLNMKLELLVFLQDIITEQDIAIVTTANREIENYFDKKIIITNYTTFRLSTQYYHAQKTKRKGVKRPEKKVIDFNKFSSNLPIILDEVQTVKNDKSQVSNAIAIHAEDFKYIYGLSGSLGYKIEDYYGVLRIMANESIPYSPSIWRNYMMDALGKYRPERVLEFKEKLLSRYLISYPDAIKVAPIHHKNIILEMGDKMRRLYMDFVEKFILQARDVNGGEEITSKKIETSFFFLMQFTSTPELLKEKFNLSWSIKNDPKLEALKSIIDMEVDSDNRKMIIWVTYPKTGELLKEILASYDPLLITGDTKKTVEREDRFDAVQVWRKDPNKKIAIFSYVLKTSLNIPEATRVVYWDVNPDNDNLVQSGGRTRRANSTEQTIAYHLMYDGSVDIYVMFNILLKKGNMKRALTDSELTLSDMKKIFNAKYVDNYTARIEEVGELE